MSRGFEPETRSSLIRSFPDFWMPKHQLNKVAILMMLSVLAWLTGFTWLLDSSLQTNILWYCIEIQNILGDNIATTMKALFWDIRELFYDYERLVPAPAHRKLDWRCKWTRREGVHVCVCPSDKSCHWRGVVNQWSGYDVRVSIVNNCIKGD